MGIHPLGDDLSVRLVTGREVWDVLGPAVANETAVTAAIAYVGVGADQLLPLRRGTTLIVNASQTAVRQGHTDPGVLLRWHRAGVRVHSLENLHAKLVLVDSRDPFVAAGSANASHHSAQRMFEAVMFTGMPEALDAARQAFSTMIAQAGEPLTEAQLAELEPIFAADRRSPAPPAPPADDDDGGDRSDDDGSDEEGDDRGDQVGAQDRVDRVWPKPRTLYLMGWNGPIELSEGAQKQLSALEAELGLGAGVTHVEGEFSLFPLAVTELIGDDLPFGYSVPVNSHILLVESPPKSAPRATARIDPPARVVGTWIDEVAYPRRKYYFLITRRWSPRRTLRDLTAALKPLGAKASFTQAYMTTDKVQAMLGLWPTATYDD